MAYKTTDGKVFEYEHEAQRHQGSLAPTPTDSAEVTAQRRGQINNLYDCLNKMIRDFNAGNWEEVIKTSWIMNSDTTYTSYRFVLPSQDKETAKIMLAIAYAKKDNNFEELHRLKNIDPEIENRELYARAMKLIGEELQKGCIERKDLPKDFTGKAKVKYDDGAVYEGEYVKGKAHGKGRVTFDGCVYEGDWVDGKYHGQGRRTWSDGSFYEGGFENGEIHGFGKSVDKYGDIEKEGY